MSKYYKADEQEIKLSDRVFAMSDDGNFYPHKLQGGWDIDESGPRWYKVLGKDDIEELGWVYKGRHWFYKQDEYYEFNIDEDNSYFLHAHYYLSEEPVKYGIINGSPTHLYSVEDSYYVFDGEIRNYNELKFIMDRVGINNKE